MAYGKKKDGDVNWGGRLVSLLFLIIFLAGIYFVYDLFKSIPINEISISGQWQLAGNPKWFLTLNADGTASSYDQFTAGDTRNQLEYTYTIKEEEATDQLSGVSSAVYIITLRENKTGATEDIKITKVSKAEMAIMKDNRPKNLTKVNIF